MKMATQSSALCKTNTRNPNRKQQSKEIVNSHSQPKYAAGSARSSTNNYNINNHNPQNHFIPINPLQPQNAQHHQPFSVSPFISPPENIHNPTLSSQINNSNNQSGQPPQSKHNSTEIQFLM